MGAYSDGGISAGTDISGAVSQGVPVIIEVVAERAAVKKTGCKKVKFENLIYGKPVYQAIVTGSIILIISGLIVETPGIYSKYISENA